MSYVVPGFNQTSQDIVAILDGRTFRPLFTGANLVSATVRETSKLTTSAVEDGTTRTDHRVLDPIEIDLPLVLTDQTRNLYEQLRSAYLQARDLIVQTRVSSYSSMMIYEILHDETPENGQSISIAVRLREIRVVQPEFGLLPPRRVTNPTQASTVKRGQKHTTAASAATQRKASTLYRLTT